jgi:hypothetical protein
MAVGRWWWDMSAVRIKEELGFPVLGIFLVSLAIGLVAGLIWIN